MPITRLGYVKDGVKSEFSVLSALPREMTMAEFALLSDEEKMGDIIVTDYPVNEESDYVEVVADGVKSIRSLLNELNDLIDRSRLCDASCLVEETSINSLYYPIYQYTNSASLLFSNAISLVISNDASIRTYRVHSTDSSFDVKDFVANTFVSYTNSVTVGDGSKLRVYYNDAHTFDFNTKAENCIFDPTGTSLVSTNAEDAIKEVDGKIPSISNNIFRSDAANSIFTFPLQHHSGNRAFIVLTRYGVWCGTVYNGAQDVTISPLYSTGDRTISGSYDNTNKELTLQFSGGLYGGITVFY